MVAVEEDQAGHGTRVLQRISRMTQRKRALTMKLRRHPELSSSTACRRRKKNFLRQEEEENFFLRQEEKKFFERAREPERVNFEKKKNIF